MNCPPIAESLVIAENARLAAQISCALAVPGHYLPVIEGPRLLRPDPVAELVRRNNAVARVRPDRIFLTGLSDEAHAGLMTRFASKLQTRMQRISTLEEIERLGDPGRFRNPPLVWGRDRIGPGLLKALRARSSIVFMGEPSPVEGLPPQSTHLVVCEQGEDLAQVIAANYAYALRAGFCLIPEIDQATSNDLLENFYSLYDERDVSPTEALERLTEQLRDLMGPLAVPAAGSITFITGGLPFGFAVPEVPSTHLFKYPDLGIAMINGLTAEQPDTPGIGFVALVDPQTTDAQEIAAAERLLPPRGAFIRTYYGAGANVRDVTAMMELFPYDLLIIATHCGDVDGHRWTYEFRDSEGLDRTMVVDIGLGMGRTDDADMLHVTQFMRFVSLDGIDWHDPQKDEKLHIGNAVLDFIAKTRSGPDQLQPMKKDTVPRVVGSSALKMHDHNLIVLPRAVADEGTPIIINNACVSWHRLAKNLIFGNARAYIGTLFPVTPTEAQEVIIKLLDKHYGKPLPAALWSAQREVYGDSPRRPYIATGVYSQRLRVKRQDIVGRMVSQLSATLAAWNKNLAGVDPNDGQRLKIVQETIAYYEHQLAHFRELAKS